MLKCLALILSFVCLFICASFKDNTAETIDSQNETNCNSDINTEKQETTNPSQTDNISEFYTFDDKDNDYCCALVLLGFENENQDYSLQFLKDAITKYNLSENFNHIENLSACDAKGNEIYLIIPKYNNSKLDIYSCVFNDDKIVRDKLLMSTDAPVILRCNLSDIYSNVEIEITNGDKVNTFSPFISLKDGTVCADDSVRILREK